MEGLKNSEAFKEPACAPPNDCWERDLDLNEENR